MGICLPFLEPQCDASGGLEPHLHHHHHIPRGAAAAAAAAVSHAARDGAGCWAMPHVHVHHSGVHAEVAMSTAVNVAVLPHTGTSFAA